MASEQEKIKELEDKINGLEKSNFFYQTKIKEYEDGDQSLYYAIQRKMKELSKILNKHKLDDVDIDDKNSKTFDRLSAIMEKCEKYALSSNALGTRLGIGQQEVPETAGVGGVKRMLTPEMIADSVGELAGMKR
jgi:chromosome segregation ATPase